MYLEYTLLALWACICSIGWVNGITGSDGILKKLPALTAWLPELIFIPLYQCSKCGAFWWCVAILLTNHFYPLGLVAFVPFLAVGITTIFTNGKHVT